MRPPRDDASVLAIDESAMPVTAWVPVLPLWTNRFGSLCRMGKSSNIAALETPYDATSFPVLAGDPAVVGGRYCPTSPSAGDQQILRSDADSGGRAYQPELHDRQSEYDGRSDGCCLHRYFSHRCDRGDDQLIRLFCCAMRRSILWVYGYQLQLDRANDSGGGNVFYSAKRAQRYDRGNIYQHYQRRHINQWRHRQLRFRSHHCGRSVPRPLCDQPEYRRFVRQPL